jgi:citrate lyase subunit beta / citryl-CoA lyase
MTDRAPLHYHYGAGDRQDVLDLLADSPADGLFIDLEDGVMPAQKDQARRNAHEFLAAGRQGSRRALLRINEVGGDHWRDDIELCAPVADRLLVPLLSGPEPLVELDRRLTRLEEDHGLPPGSRKVHILIETAGAAVRLGELMAATPRLAGVLYGQADFTLSLGCQGITAGVFRPAPMVEWVHPLLLLHARAAGVEAVTLPWAASTDPQGHIDEMRRLFALGYDAMIVGSAEAVERVHEAYRPAGEDLAFAQAIRRTYDEAVAAGMGTSFYEGWLVEGAYVRIADRLLERANV